MVLRRVFKDFSEDELMLLRNSYDVVGDIAILEIPKELRVYEERIAGEILKLKNINTVVRKEGGHKGVYRLQKYEFLGGVDKRETIHKENGVNIKLDIEKVYFSPRLGNERLRIARLVKDCENVLVMFSGCGVYPLIIARNSRAKEVYGVEINKIACRYAEENLKLNNVRKIRLFCDDVRGFRLDKKFDRIIMPLPFGGEEFLKDAKRFSKKGTFVHYYSTSGDVESMFKDVIKMVKKVFKGCKILGILKCGQVSTRIYRVCVDFKV